LSGIPTGALHEISVDQADHDLVAAGCGG